MGWYDSINGEQVKCFPVIFPDTTSSADIPIIKSSGNLRTYGKGDLVPYKTPYYNYGKNFTILDDIGYGDLWDEGNVYIIHVIRDGRVKESYDIDMNIDMNNLNSIRMIPEDFSTNETVVNYYGKLLDISSFEEMEMYLTERVKLNKLYNKLCKEEIELKKERRMIKIELKNTQKDSKEYQEILTVVEKLNEKISHHDKEKEKILRKPREGFNQRWNIDNVKELVKLSEFGMIVDIIQRYQESDKINKDYINRLTKQLEEALLNKYCEWQKLSEEERDYIEKLLK